MTLDSLQRGRKYVIMGVNSTDPVVQRLMEIQPFGSLLLWAAELAPFLMLCGVFTFFYKFIPNTQVKIGSAFVGGISAAILWGIAGEVFAKFVAASAKYSAIYSSFAVLILFLLWLVGAATNVVGGLIHLLLVVGLLVFLWNALTTRRTA